MKKTVMKSAGPLMKFTRSQKTRRPTRIVAKTGRTKLLAGRRGLTIGSLDASVTISRLWGRRAETARRLDSPSRCLGLLRQVRRRGEGLERVELPCLLLVDRDGRQVRIALGVDRERAEDPVRHFEPEQVLRDRRTRAGRLRDRVEH